MRLAEAARLTGADVPVCLDPRPRMMRGIGEILSAPVAIAALPAVLVNPGVSVPTKAVFVKLAAPPLSSAPATSLPPAPALAGEGREGVIAALAGQRNDLEPPAIAIQPVIADVLAALRATAQCRLARMSGSGATCFALYGSGRAAAAAARALREQHPGWWVRATTLGP